MRRHELRCLVSASYSVGLTMGDALTDSHFNKLFECRRLEEGYSGRKVDLRKAVR